MFVTLSTQTVPPHFRCDCVRDLGPAHCHRCGIIAGALVEWEKAACKELMANSSYRSLLSMGDEALLLRASKAFDAKRQAWQEAPAIESALPKPAAIPAPPKTTLVSAQERRDQYLDLAPWRFTNLARGQLKTLDITERAIVAILNGPHVQMPSRSGTAMNHYGDGLLIMVDVDGECIISVIERKMPAYLRREVQPRSAAAPTAGPPVKHKSHHGGAGRRMPSTLKEILAMLTEHGFTAELGGSGHRRVTHPAHPEVRVSIPSSPSDRRAYLNAVADIKRRTGIDITKTKD